MKIKFLIGIISCLLFVSPAKAGDVSAGAQVNTQSSAGLNLSQVFEGSEQLRSLPFVPSFSGIPLNAAHFERATNPSNFESVKDFTALKKEWTRKELVSIVKGQKIIINFDNFYNIEITEEEKSPDDIIQIIWCERGKPFNRIVVPVGKINNLGKNKSISGASIAQSGLDAMDTGATALLFYNEGVDRELKNKSGDLSIMGFISAISGGIGKVGGGGAGNVKGSQGNSEYIHHVWVQAFAVIHYSREELLRNKE